MRVEAARLPVMEGYGVLCNEQLILSFRWLLFLVGYTKMQSLSTMQLNYIQRNASLCQHQ